MTTQAEVDRLAAAAYISLTTFKRDASEVATPVWVAGEGDRLYVWTERSSGKAKRIRNGGRVRLAPCDARGRVQGSAVEGTARVLDAPADVEAVQRRLHAKYGLQFLAWKTIGRVIRRNTDYVGIEVELA